MTEGLRHYICSDCDFENAHPNLNQQQARISPTHSQDHPLRFLFPRISPAYQASAPEPTETAMILSEPSVFLQILVPWAEKGKQGWIHNFP